MKKRTINKFTAFLILLTLLTGLPATALAAEKPAVIFSEMTSSDSIGEFTALADQLMKDCQNSQNSYQVVRDFDRLLDLFESIETHYNLTSIHFYQDVTDTAKASNNASAYDSLRKAYDLLLITGQAILESECKDAARNTWPQPRIAFLLTGRSKTDQQEALAAEESQLIQQYTMSADSGKGLDDIYIQLIQVRTKMAALYNLDSYSEMGFYQYSRSYEPEDARRLCAAVKTHIVPILSRFEDLDREALSKADSLYSAFSTDEILLFMQEKMAGLSPKLSEAFQYMLDYQLYDLEYSTTKADMGFTTFLADYSSPFIFYQPHQDFRDLLTYAHEFGHFYAFYEHPDDSKGWESEFQIDLSEIHSQSLELIFGHFYTDLLGPKAGEAILDYALYDSLTDLTAACAVYEFEMKAYENPDVTASELDQLFYTVLRDYGVIEANAPLSSATWWRSVPHLYQQPLYYISYAVSVVPSLEIWLMYQENPQLAIETYLDLAAYGEGPAFSTVLRACGLKNPFQEDTVKSLADALSQYKSVAASSPYFSDLETHWARDSVKYTIDAGLFSGLSETVFGPDQQITRGMFVTVLSRLHEHTSKTITPPASSTPFSDVDYSAWYGRAVAWATDNGIVSGASATRFAPDEPVSREEMAVMLNNYLAFTGRQYSQSGSKAAFLDQSAISSWALNSVLNMQSQGVLNGSDGYFQPQETATRAEAATVFHHLLVLNDA